MKRKAALTALVARALVALALALALVWSPRAEAHTIGLSTGEYTVKGASVVGTLAFARGEVRALVPGVDTDHDGHLTPSEIASGRAVLARKILGKIVVRAGGAPCKVTLTDAGLTEEDGMLLSGRWDCPSATEPFELELALLDGLARGHRHIARAVTGAATHDEVLFGDDRALTIAPEALASSASVADDADAGAGRGAGLGALFWMGIDHILTGYDHLVFILGLVLVCVKVRSLLTIVTAFTVAHSITLAVAVLGVWAPSPRIIEPAIALSIVYVGIENFFVKDAQRRWRITFPFGLIHGFGFAGALQEIALPWSSAPVALAAFNLGVEAGQLGVLAVLLPLILVLRGKAWFEPRGVRLVSGAIAVAGCVWFVARVA